MMKKWQRNLLIGIIAVVVLVGVLLGVRAIIMANQKEPATTDEPVASTVERETVAMIVAKFNTEVMDVTQWELEPANDEAMVTYENNYWYPLAEDISLVVVPEEFTSNKDNDIVKVALIYSNKDESNQHVAREYWQYLVKANNSELDDETVAKLLEDAERLKAEDSATDPVKGVAAAIFEDDNHFEFQVLRNY